MPEGARPGEPAAAQAAVPEWERAEPAVRAEPVAVREEERAAEPRVGPAGVPVTGVGPV
ncbi:hypothetical protein H0176_27525, partial [Methylorubrum populi]|nr:hypothetical protein [Methylorubrum rhodesianum]MBY0143968.1 hypothetical protein [Methylorubrum populi]